MIVVDISALVASLCGSRPAAPRLRQLFVAGERLVLPVLVLYEWWRGPRIAEELAAQETLFPRDQAPAFGPLEAARAAELYRSVGRPRGRELDLAIAAQALVLDAGLWTLDPADFADIPGLLLVPPA